MAGFKRKIFYLSGFDPRGARFYHQLYAEQAALFAANAGQATSVSRRRRSPPHDTSWTIESRDRDGRIVAETDYSFLGWDDLVRAHWVQNPLALIRKSIHAYIGFTRELDWPIVNRFPLGTRVAFYYPGVVSLLLPLLLGLLLWLPLAALLPWYGALAAVAAIAIGVSIFVVHKIQGFWLLRFIIFNDAVGEKGLAEDIRRRLEGFADRIAAEMDKPWDEILLVTHSNGSIIGVPIMARLLDRFGNRLPDHFSFVTLGSCIALLGCRKDSREFHALLDRVGQGDFRWLDIGSITDGACIAGIDPCVSTPRKRTARLFQTSPRWFKYCAPETYDARRRNKYEVHFDYLRTFDRISPLDYIAITSGARPLARSIAAFSAENEGAENEGGA